MKLHEYALVGDQPVTAPTSTSSATQPSTSSATQPSTTRVAAKGAKRKPIHKKKKQSTSTTHSKSTAESQAEDEFLLDEAKKQADERKRELEEAERTREAMTAKLLIDLDRATSPSSLPPPPPPPRSKKDTTSTIRIPVSIDTQSSLPVTPMPLQVDNIVPFGDQLMSQLSTTLPAGVFDRNHLNLMLLEKVDDATMQMMTSQSVQDAAAFLGQYQELVEKCLRRYVYATTNMMLDQVMNSQPLVIAGMVAHGWDEDTMRSILLAEWTVLQRRVWAARLYIDRAMDHYRMFCHKNSAELILPRMMSDSRLTEQVDTLMITNDMWSTFLSWKVKQWAAIERKDEDALLAWQVELRRVTDLFKKGYSFKYLLESMTDRGCQLMTELAIGASQTTHHQMVLRHLFTLFKSEGRYVCAQCFTEKTDTAVTNGGQCKRCCQIYYCSSQCQLLNWNHSHRHFCSGKRSGSPSQEAR